MLNPDQARRARDGIVDTLTSIDRGELAAAQMQRAYLEGARDALNGALEDREPPVLPV